MSTVTLCITSAKKVGCMYCNGCVTDSNLPISIWNFLQEEENSKETTSLKSHVFMARSSLQNGSSRGLQSQHKRSVNKTYSPTAAGPGVRSKVQNGCSTGLIFPKSIFFLH